MRRIYEYFRGSCLLCIRGPWPEQALSDLAEAGVSFRDVRADHEGLLIRIRASHLQRAQAICRAAGCEAKLQKRSGFRHTFRGLARRWCLFAGCLLLLGLIYLSQSRIWYLDVEGNVTLEDEQILQALESIGIGVGTPGSAIDGQYIKNHMLNLLPELEWISVNRRGAHAIVLVHERDETPEVVDSAAVCNIVAAKAGIVTDMQVYSGFPVVEKGKAVLPGELLVSGIAEGFRAIVTRNAQAEVYALTRYETTLLLPTSYGQAVYTGGEETSWALVIGDKRYNFSQMSGIPLTGYDKIETVYPLTLPGGLEFPVALVKTVCKPYTLQTVQLDEDAAFSMLSEAEERYVSRQLIAGTILQSDAELTQRRGWFFYHAITQASEMIARPVQINPFEQ